MLDVFLPCILGFFLPNLVASECLFSIVYVSTLGLGPLFFLSLFLFGSIIH